MNENRTLIGLLLSVSPFWVLLIGGEIIRRLKKRSG